MSRIGNAPIAIPNDVTVTVSPTSVHVRGPKGELELSIPLGINCKQEGMNLIVVTLKNDKKTRALHGFIRASLMNDIQGVTRGWTKTLEFVGVGYRANLIGQNVELTIGFSHPVVIEPPPGIAFQIQDGKLVISGNNKQSVGQIAASIRSIKKPEPYKGKGIRYEGEYIRKKAG